MDEALARAAFDRALGDYHQDFGTFFLARLFELDIAYEDDACRVTIPVRDFQFNPQGTLHGGVIAFVLDVSMGHLLRRSFDAPGTTLEMKTQFLRPIRRGPVRCEARFLRRGRSVSFLESRLHDGEGKLAAVASSTWRLLEPQSGAAPANAAE